VNALGVVSADRTNINFGMERAPDTAPLSASISNPVINGFVTLSGGSNPPVFAGSDPEDQPAIASLSGKTIAITSLPANGQLWYNGTQITNGDDNATVPSISNPKRITGFDPTKMQVRFTGSGYSSISFTYAYVDAANMIDLSPAAYALNWSMVLPVRLTSFAAKLNGTVADLRWTAADELNLQAYEVERSEERSLFRSIATIATKGGSTNEYSYSDRISTSTGAKIYYRLKQVDNDGRFTYSSVVWVKPDVKDVLTLTVTPNPVKGPVTVSINAVQEAPATISITDYTGKKIVFKNARLFAGTNNIAIETNQQLANGVYVLSLEVSGKVYQRKFVVQR
jgi:hypothetical protein